MKKIILLFCVVFVALCVVSAESRELYEIVELDGLSAQYADKRITVFGYIRDMKVVRGRLGSKSMLMNVGEGDHEVSVAASFEVIGTLLHQYVVVQGKYIQNCWVGGIELLDSCIRLEYISVYRKEKP